MRMTEQEYEEFCKKRGWGKGLECLPADDDNTTDTTPYLEPDPSDAPLRTHEATAFDTPVRITIHSRRHRLADPDGISAKAVIDGLVKAGILKDDTAKEIGEVRFQQTKIHKNEQETTEISITEYVGD